MQRSLVTPENLNQTFLLVPAKLRLVALGAFVLWKCAQVLLGSFKKVRKKRQMIALLLI